MNRTHGATSRSLARFASLPGLLLLAAGCLVTLEPQPVRAELQAGAAIVDVTPLQFPVLVNGGMRSRTADQVHTRLYARAVVVADGEQQAAIVVVDSCMLPRPLLDEAKQLAAQRTDIPAAHMLISATHTHTAPASMGCLGTDADPTYVPYLREKLAEAIAAAQKQLQPASIGWGSIDAADYTALRRWIRRPDRLGLDPFGNPTVRANMHAAANWDDVIGPSGPEDPELSMIAFRSKSGRPIALLANYSMHYFGDRALSADYFGLFCNAVQNRLDPAEERSEDAQPFVALLSHGCSGDIWRRDYAQPPEQRNDTLSIDQYSAALVDLTLQAYQNIEYQSDADLAMAETRLHLDYRTPDKQRLEWAQRIVDAMGDRLPETSEEVYAKEQLILHERQSTDVVVQALRIGDIGIATTPNETYALTGLKVKLQSPLRRTMVIELANGGDGYIPPPEQHLLGGYNTWAARSAGLEVEAEPKIAEAAVLLLERVSGQPRRDYVASRGPAAQAIASTQPLAWWRLDEMAGPRARDASGNHRHAIYEPRIAYFLDGPHSERFNLDGEPNRAAHFAGDRLQAHLDDLGQDYSVSLWFWNGMPAEARDVTGWMFSRGHAFGLSPQSEHLGLGGKGENAGKLVFLQGNRSDELQVGKTTVDRWTWNHVVLTRQQNQVRVYLNGKLELSFESDAPSPDRVGTLFFGGRSDDQSNWEGKLDEIAVFDRALSADDVKRLSGE